MKRVTFIFALLMSLEMTGAAYAAAQAMLKVKGPTVVIFTDSPSEQKRHEDDDEYNEFSSDFAVYAGRLVKALEPYRQIAVRSTSAFSVSFPDMADKPIMRSKLESGWGFVFYAPGKKPVVFSGVVEDNELVCAAMKLYKIHVNGYEC